MYPVLQHSRSTQAEIHTQADIINEWAAADCGHYICSEGAVPEAGIYLQKVTPQPAGSMRNTSQLDQSKELG